MSDRISVVIPVYNGARHLAAAIESVLRQTVPVLEVIVVDDGSTDHSADIARRFGDQVCLLNQPNSGAAVARNFGIQHAQGNFLAFLDADDLWSERKLEWQLRALKEPPYPEVVYGMAEEFYSDELDDTAKRSIRPLKSIQPAHVAGAMLISSENFHRVGFFNPELRIAETVEWFARARELQLKEVVIPEVVLQRRIHSSNSGLRISKMEYVRVIKESLDRRSAKKQS